MIDTMHKKKCLQIIKYFIKKIMKITSKKMIN